MVQTVNHAYNQFEIAMHLFDRIGKKSAHLDKNQSNLGKAICLSGMAQILFEKSYCVKNKDEDSCFREAAQHYE